MEFKIRTNAIYAEDEELLKDLRRVAKLLKKENITTKEYKSHGNYHPATFMRRFDGWNDALLKAGLKVGLIRIISDKELFDNLEIIWKSLGRQPFINEIKKPLSKYNHATYQRRFGSRIETCKAFIQYKKNDLEFIKIAKSKNTAKNRNISEKDRLRVLKRDNYTCVKCGRSPATQRGCILHIDHIMPFSKGGNNLPENLQTLCDKCNLGKGNDENV